MKKLVTFCVMPALAVAMAGCNSGSGNHDADVAAIKAGEVQWNADFASHNVDKVVSHYADDAVLIVPESPADSGKAAIAASMKMMISDPATVLKFEAKRVEVSSSGDMAYSQGTYTMSVKDPQTGKMVDDHGNYVTTYKKQADGTWKAEVDSVTSEVPVPSPAPAPAAEN
jgi:uncharacterized protein (TIGR02246 family)